MADSAPVLYRDTPQSTVRARANQDCTEKAGRSQTTQNTAQKVDSVGDIPASRLQHANGCVVGWVSLQKSRPVHYEDSEHATSSQRIETSASMCTGPLKPG